MGTKAIVGMGTRTYVNDKEVREVTIIKFGGGFLELEANFLPNDPGQQEIMNNPPSNVIRIVYPPAEAEQQFVFFKKRWIVEVNPSEVVRISARFANDTPDADGCSDGCWCCRVAVFCHAAPQHRILKTGPLSASHASPFPATTP